MSMNNETNAGKKLQAIIQQQADIKVALKEIQARRRAQERADRQRLEALIGAAVLADLESASQDSHDGRRAYVCQVLDRYIQTEGSRAFIRSKGMLPLNGQKVNGNNSPDRDDGSGRLT